MVWFCNFWRRVFKHFCCTSFATKKILEIIYFKVFHHSCTWFLCWSPFEDFIFAGFRKSLVILLWINNVCKKKTSYLFSGSGCSRLVSFYLQLVQFLNPPECLHPNFPPRKLIQFIFLISFNKQLWITLLDRSSILEFFAVIFYSNLNMGFVFEFDDCVFSYWAWRLGNSRRRRTIGCGCGAQQWAWLSGWMVQANVSSLTDIMWQNPRMTE